MRKRQESNEFLQAHVQKLAYFGGKSERNNEYRKGYKCFRNQ